MPVSEVLWLVDIYCKCLGDFTDIERDSRWLRTTSVHHHRLTMILRPPRPQNDRADAMLMVDKEIGPVLTLSAESRSP